MDASRRNFLRGAAAAILAASVPAPPAAAASAYGQSPAVAAIPDARLIATLQRALDHAMNPPLILHEDGTTSPMDNSMAWETLDVIYKHCKERGLVPCGLTVTADEQVIARVG